MDHLGRAGRINLPPLRANAVALVRVEVERNVQSRSQSATFLVESRRSAFGRADNVSGRLFIKLATAATRPNFGHAPLL